jgi:hypothetical protein
MRGAVGVAVLTRSGRIGGARNVARSGWCRGRRRLCGPARRRGRIGRLRRRRRRRRRRARPPFAPTLRGGRPGSQAGQEQEQQHEQPEDEADADPRPEQPRSFIDSGRGRLLGRGGAGCRGPRARPQNASCGPRAPSGRLGRRRRAKRGAAGRILRPEAGGRACTRPRRCGSCAGPRRPGTRVRRPLRLLRGASERRRRSGQCQGGRGCRGPNERGGAAYAR